LKISFEKWQKFTTKKSLPPTKSGLNGIIIPFVIPWCESNFSHLMGFVPTIYICYLGNTNGHGKVVFWDLVKSIAIMSFSKH